MKLLAADPKPIPLGGTIGGSGLGPFGNIGDNTDPSAGLKGVTDVVSSVVGLMTVVASIWFLFNILYGGYEWLASGGDAKKIASARDHITHAFIGLVIVMASWSLLAVAGQFFGFNTLINPSEVIQQLNISAP